MSGDIDMLGPAAVADSLAAGGGLQLGCPAHNRLPVLHSESLQHDSTGSAGVGLETVLDCKAPCVVQHSPIAIAGIEAGYGEDIGMDGHRPSHYGPNYHCCKWELRHYSGTAVLVG
jgi:hypothetical protein